MTYIEGFITPVPTANKDAYLRHARKGAAILAEFGVHRMVECWGDDVPHGKTTDFRRAVRAKEDETVLFSWFEYPDKAARDAANAKMMADPRMGDMMKEMPFDAGRMVYGGFEAAFEGGDGGSFGYIDGVVAAVKDDERQAFIDHAARTAAIFREKGATRIVDAWGDDVAAGEITDFRRAVQAGDGETVIFGWLEWPDKATRDAGMASLYDDPRMQADRQPWNGPTAIFGGFAPIFDTDQQGEQR